MSTCHFLTEGCVNTGAIEIAMLDVTGGRRGTGASTTGLCICDMRGVPGGVLLKGEMGSMADLQSKKSGVRAA